MHWGIILLLNVLIQQSMSNTCEDSLSKDSPLEVQEGKVIHIVTNCKQLVDKYLIMCKLVGFEGGRCCKSCRGKESNTCEDSVSRNRPLKVRRGKFTDSVMNCKQLVNKYLIMCKKVGREGGRCCKSCRGKDLTCIDDSLKFWMVGEERQNCAAYVAGDPCRCDKRKWLKTKCCASCENAVCDKCRDYLSEDTYIEVTNAGGEKEKITDCTDLVTNYLSLCRKYGKEGQRCCQSCSKKDLTCIDNSLKFWRVGGERQNCAQYVAGDPCRCEMGNVKKACCASCENAVCDQCRDTHRGDVTITDGGSRGAVLETFKNCETLVKKHLILCDIYGGDDGRCCGSCQGKDLACIDNTLMFFYLEGFTKLSCPQYIAGDKCKCGSAMVKKECCASCKDVDLDECCQESTTWRGTVKSGEERCRMCTCAEINTAGLMEAACKPSLSEARNNCCRSCTDLGYPPRLPSTRYKRSSSCVDMDSIWGADCQDVSQYLS